MYPRDIRRSKKSATPHSTNWGPGKGEEEVATRMWMADQEVHQAAARRQPLEKNEKKEGRPTAVISSRMLNQLYKRPRLRKQRVTLDYV